MRLFTSLLLSLLFTACSEKVNEEGALQTGPWRMDLDMNGHHMPFLFEFSENKIGGLSMTIQNGAERIPVDDVSLKNDSIFIRLPLFDSEFKGLIRERNTITGSWHNYLRGPDHSIPFIANAGDTERFLDLQGKAADIGGSWQVHFSPDGPKAYAAIGVFDQGADGLITGTFITETGDHRYLEGVARNDSLKLSAFDGSHAYLFAAAIEGDSMAGKFWSGIHWEEPWYAKRDAGFALRHPDSLTSLRSDVSRIDLSFPDLQGKMVSLSDERFQDGPVIVQIMGSWCPNCVDETRLMNELYDTYNPRGLEMLAVAFEKQEDPVKAVEKLERFKSTLNVKYPIVYAGKASKEEAAAKLPFLDHVMSYPTSIILDHTGKVRRIRTGFYGPGTGEHYERYRQELESFLERLLVEKATAQIRK